MSVLVLEWSILAAQAMLAVACALAVGRMLVGPRAQDRILALDAFYVVAMLLFMTLGLRMRSDVFFEAALTIAVVGFVGTVALAKFLMRGEVIE